MKEKEMQTEKWTHDQAVAFEAARDCITDMMGICSAKLAEEEAKTPIDDKRLSELECQLADLARERSNLTVYDDLAVAQIRTRYGAMVRAYRT
jgi:hypothetical protein